MLLASTNLDSPSINRITMKNLKSKDRTRNKCKVNDAKMNIIEDIKTEVNDESAEDEDKICDEDRVKVEVDNDFNYARHEVIKKEPIGDDKVNNEIVDINIVKKENIDDDGVNIKEETPSNDDVDNNKLKFVVARQEKRKINGPLWNMRFLPNLNELTRTGHNKDTDPLITFRSRINEQKNIIVAKRTDERLRCADSTDRLRICGACNKSLRSMKTANYRLANYKLANCIYVINYKPPQQTNSDETTDSCDMCNRAYPRNTQKFCFKCTFCHFETNSRYRLNTHTNARHTKRIRYTCVYCSFKTYVKVKLGSHVNVTHTECLTCQYCEYVAKFKSYLNKHVCAQHASTKVFSCNFCTYSSKQKGSLNKHFVDVHTETLGS